MLIYKCVAEEVGLAVRGINSPGHFLAAVQCAEPRRSLTGPNDNWMYVDPFYGGELLDGRRRLPPDRRNHRPRRAALARLARLRPRIANGSARMLNNLQAVFAHTGRERDLYAMQELQELLS